MSAWINLGDIDPENGTFLVDRDTLRLDIGRQSLSARCVAVVPERSFGGASQVFMLQQGVLTLHERDFASALETVGARIEGDDIVAPGHGGEDVRTPIDSAEGRQELIHAAHAYGGMPADSEDIVVATDLPCPEEAARDIFGEPDLWYFNPPSLWAVMRDAFGDFDHFPEDAPGRAERLSIDGPLEGLTRDLRTRADLMHLGGFRDLDTDSDGNPCVWENHYVHVDPETDLVTERWTDCWSCQCDDEDPVTGRSVSPEESVWIGPEHPVLKELWDRLPEEGAPVVPEPGSDADPEP